MTEQYLQPDQVVGVFPGLSARWLSRQRWERKGPAYIKAGKRILYRLVDLEAWMEAQTVSPDGCRG